MKAGERAIKGTRVEGLVVSKQGVVEARSCWACRGDRVAREASSLILVMTAWAMNANEAVPEDPALQVPLDVLSTTTA